MDPDPLDLAKQQARLCAMFGSTQRVLILWALAEKGLTVSEIAVELNASIQNTSHHLRLMKDLGIIESQREGQSIRYRLANQAIPECLLESISRTSGRMKNHP